MRVPKDKDSPLDKEYQELVTRTLEYWHVPGVAVAVVDGEKIYAQVSSLHSIFISHIYSLFNRATVSHYYLTFL